MNSPLYLRDLKPELRAIEEKRIRDIGNKKLVAALDKGRDITIGIEKEEPYMKIAEARIAHYTVKPVKADPDKVQKAE